MSLGDQPVSHSLQVGEALFALGLALPLFAGGNTLLALEPRVAMQIFAAVAILVSWRILRLAEAPPPLSVLVANASLLLLGSWWTATLALRPSGPRAFIEAQGMLCGILLFAVLSRQTLTPDATARFVRGLLIGSLGTAAFGLYQHWVVFPRTMPLARAAGIPAFGLVNANFYSPNSYAIFLAAVILIAVGLVISNRVVWPWMPVAFLVLTTGFTKSRAAIALLAIGGVALGSVTGSLPSVRSRRAATVLFFVLLPAAAGAAAASMDLSEFWHVATMGRIAIWRGTLEIVREHWLVGVGLGRFGVAFSQFWINDYHTLYPHCFLLEVAAELGVIGILALIGFLAAALVGPTTRLVDAGRLPNGRVDGLSIALFAACVVLLIHGLIDIDWHAPANPILLFVLLGALQQLRVLSEDPRGA